MINKKYRNDKGFTLAELLIVVAIIAVLVAVSIPIFTAQLEKAREETDAANWRAAKAAFVYAMLIDDKPGDLLIYDAQNGETYSNIYDDDKTFEEAASRPYGKGTKAHGYPSDEYFEWYDPDVDFTNAVIRGKYNSKDESFTMYWYDTKKDQNIIIRGLPEKKVDLDGYGQDDDTEYEGDYEDDEGANKKDDEENP